MKKIQKKHGIVFWITGLSGSGKTSLAKKITNTVRKNYGPTICFHGDELRQALNLKSYNKKDRLKIGKIYIRLIKMITAQKINVIISVVGLFHELHKYNRKSFKNYLEIFVKSDIKLLKGKKKRIFYKKKIANVWGIDLKPEFPKKPDITIVNNFENNLNFLSKKLILQIKKKI
jgi:adenylylsulfate kinase